MDYFVHMYMYIRYASAAIVTVPHSRTGWNGLRMQPVVVA